MKTKPKQAHSSLPLKLEPSPGHPLDDGLSDASGEWCGTARKDVAGVIVHHTNHFAALQASHEALAVACKMMQRWCEMSNEDAPDIEELTLLTVTEHVESALATATALQNKLEGK